MCPLPFLSRNEYSRNAACGVVWSGEEEAEEEEGEEEEEEEESERKGAV